MQLRKIDEMLFLQLVCYRRMCAYTNVTRQVKKAPEPNGFGEKDKVLFLFILVVSIPPTPYSELMFVRLSQVTSLKTNSSGTG